MTHITEYRKSTSVPRSPAPNEVRILTSCVDMIILVGFDLLVDREYKHFLALPNFTMLCNNSSTLEWSRFKFDLVYCLNCNSFRKYSKWISQCFATVSFNMLSNSVSSYEWFRFQFNLVCWVEHKKNHCFKNNPDIIRARSRDPSGLKIVVWIIIVVKCQFYVFLRFVLESLYKTKVSTQYFYYNFQSTMYYYSPSSN